MPPKSIESNMNLRPTNAIPETKTLTHHGHSTSKLSMDSSLRAIKFHYRIIDACFCLYAKSEFPNPCLPCLRQAQLEPANFFRGELRRERTYNFMDVPLQDRCVPCLMQRADIGLTPYLTRNRLQLNFRNCNIASLTPNLLPLKNVFI